MAKRRKRRRRRRRWRRKNGETTRRNGIMVRPSALQNAMNHNGECCTCKCTSYAIRSMYHVDNHRYLPDEKRCPKILKYTTWWWSFVTSHKSSCRRFSAFRCLCCLFFPFSALTYSYKPNELSTAIMTMDKRKKYRERERESGSNWRVHIVQRARNRENPLCCLSSHCNAFIAHPELNYAFRPQFAVRYFPTSTIIIN